MMGTLRSEVNRRRAGSFYQSGSLAFGALAVFLLVSLSASMQLSSLGWIVAALVVLPSLFALAAPAQHMIGEHPPRETAAHIWREFKSHSCAGMRFPIRSSSPLRFAAAP